MTALTTSTTHKSSLPAASVLRRTDEQSDYIDSYSSVIELPDGQTPAIEDMAKAFFASGPEWVDHLFTLRNKIVGLLGLKTGRAGNKQQLLNNFTCEPGDKLGLFKVFAKNEQEVILGEDDKHLNFRVSLFVGKSDTGLKNELVISTVVKFNNWLGRLYFIPVKPFHRLIVPVMLRGIAKQLQPKR